MLTILAFLFSFHSALAAPREEMPTPRPRCNYDKVDQCRVSYSAEEQRVRAEAGALDQRCIAKAEERDLFLPALEEAKKTLGSVQNERAVVDEESIFSEKKDSGRAPILGDFLTAEDLFGVKEWQRSWRSRYTEEYAEKLQNRKTELLALEKSRSEQLETISKEISRLDSQYQALLTQKNERILTADHHLEMVRDGCRQQVCGAL